MPISYTFRKATNKKRSNNLNDLIRTDKHNNRKVKTRNVKSENENVTLVGTHDIVSDLQELYKKEFDESVKNYNATQKRNDRKINDYFEKVSNDKQVNLYDEIIIQLGCMEDFQENGAMDWWTKTELINYYKSQLQAMAEYLPDFKIANATIHFDESTPHLHIVGVPIKEYVKGMSKRVSGKEIFNKEKLSQYQTDLRNFDKPFINIQEKRKGRGYTLPPSEYKLKVAKIKEIDKDRYDRIEQYKEYVDQPLSNELINHLELIENDIQATDETLADLSISSNSIDDEIINDYEKEQFIEKYNHLDIFVESDEIIELDETIDYESEINIIDYGLIDDTLTVSNLNANELIKELDKKVLETKKQGLSKPKMPNNDELIFDEKDEEQISESKLTNKADLINIDKLKRNIELLKNNGMDTSELENIINQYEQKGKNIHTPTSSPEPREQPVEKNGYIIHKNEKKRVSELKIANNEELEISNNQNDNKQMINDNYLYDKVNNILKEKVFDLYLSDDLTDAYTDYEHNYLPILNDYWDSDEMIENKNVVIDEKDKDKQSNLIIQFIEWIIELIFDKKREQDNNNYLGR